MIEDAIVITNLSTQATPLPLSLAERDKERNRNGRIRPAADYDRDVDGDTQLAAQFLVVDARVYLDLSIALPFASAILACSIHRKSHLFVIHVVEGGESSALFLQTRQVV